MHSWRKTVSSVAWRTCSAADYEKMEMKMMKEKKKKMEQQMREKEI